MSIKFNSERYRIASLRKHAMKRLGTGMSGMSSFSTPSSSSNNYNSSYGSSYGAAGHANTNRYNPVFDDLSEGTIVEQFMPVDPRRLHRIWRRIYLQDPVAGGAVELYKELPWSDFQITGIEDPHIEKFYEDALNAIDIVSLLPELSAEFLVMGKLIGYLHMDDSVGYPTRLIIHDPDWIRVTPIPIPGFAPKLDLIPTPEMRAFANSQDERDREAQAQVQGLIQLIREGKEVPLAPSNSFYLPRKTSPYDNVGASVYTRILMFVAYEKALFNATIATSKRRMSNIRHLVAGIPDEWTPSGNELSELSDIFMQADEDPVGAIVVTRNGIDMREASGGTLRDIVKIGDEWRFLVSGKLNSLGVSEAFLSGEANYNTLEQLMSVFLERVKAHRDYFVRQLLIKEILLPLAVKHNFVRRKQAHLDHRIRIVKANNDENIGRYVLPTFNFQKSLRPIADRDYLEILGMMEEKGIPVTINTWAASAGFDVEAEIGQFDEDVEIRKQLAKQTKHIQAVAPEAAGQPGAPGGGGGFGGGDFGGGGLGDLGGGGFGEDLGGDLDLGGEDLGGGDLGEGGDLELPTAASYKQADSANKDDISKAIHIINELPYWNNNGTFMGLQKKKVAQTAINLLNTLGSKDSKALNIDEIERLLRTGNVKRDTIQRFILARSGILHGVYLGNDAANDITNNLLKSIESREDLAQELQYVYAFQLASPATKVDKKQEKCKKSKNIGNIGNKKINLNTKIGIKGDKKDKLLLTGYTEK